VFQLRRKTISGSIDSKEAHILIKLPNLRANFQGPEQGLYAELKPSPNETSFQVDNVSG